MSNILVFAAEVIQGLHTTEGSSAREIWGAIEMSADLKRNRSSIAIQHTLLKGNSWFEEVNSNSCSTS